MFCTGASPTPMRLALLLILALTVAAAGSSRADAQAQCEHSAAAAPALERLRDALAHGRFVSYQPTSLTVVDGRVSNATPAGIRADLTLLRPHFDALITYDAVHGAQQIAPIAAALKFRALVIGIWDPFDPAELDAALDAARRFPKLVVGLSLGNEMIFSHRADPQRLTAVVQRVRAQDAQLPLATSEPFHIYETPEAAPLLGSLDFLLVNVHPVFQPWFRGASAETAAQFVVNVASGLAGRYCGPLVVKETGIPTAPAEEGFSGARQAAFYAQLRRLLPPNRQRAFAYFAAFDAPWRAQDATGVPGPHPSEAFWGLFDSQRRPKPAIDQLPPLGQDRHN
jgi:exo-beta-1,3-glucanase (GH17 family)